MCTVHFSRIAALAAFAMLLLSTHMTRSQAGSTAAEGRQFYNAYCYQCHGANMVNTGSNAPDLRKFPLSQKSRFVKSVKEGKGQGKMPAWGDILNREQIDKIWSYVKTRGKI